MQQRWPQRHGLVVVAASRHTKVASPSCRRSTAPKAFGHWITRRQMQTSPHGKIWLAQGAIYKRDRNAQRVALTPCAPLSSGPHAVIQTIHCPLSKQCGAESTLSHSQRVVVPTRDMMADVCSRRRKESLIRSVIQKPLRSSDFIAVLSSCELPPALAAGILSR